MRNRDFDERCDEAYEQHRDRALDARANLISKAEARAKREALERAFAIQCRAASLAPVPQFKIDGLNYRWDFAFPELRLLIEIQGGIWTGGAHARGAGLTRDYRKANAATLAGWHTLFFTSSDIKDGSALRTVQTLLSRCA